jgi:hypothetical protein
VLELDLLDNDTAIALKPAGERLLAKLETSEEVCEQPMSSH